jgi:hypothetical protein
VYNNVRLINLTGTPFTEAGIQTTAQCCVCLEVMYIAPPDLALTSAPAFSARVVARAGNCPQLEELYLSIENTISTRCVEALALHVYINPWAGFC